jgi:hypothetical protein
MLRQVSIHASERDHDVDPRSSAFNSFVLQIDAHSNFEFFRAPSTIDCARFVYDWVEGPDNWCSAPGTGAC